MTYIPSKFVRACLAFTILLLSIGAGQTAFAEINSYKARSGNNRFSVEVIPAGKTELNRLYSWQAKIIPSASSVLASADYVLKPGDIKISGGMPAHGHGLPTRPRVTHVSRTSNGEFLLTIEGLKFQMWGDWVLVIALPGISDKAEASFNLAP